MVVISILFVATANAQESSIQFELSSINYTTNEGLPSNECHQIVQDDKGYIWIATDNGLSRFDGYGFKNYGYEEGLIDNIIFYLQKGNDGKIWMLSKSGQIFYYDHLDDVIKPYKYNALIRKYDEFIWAGPFYLDINNNMYLTLMNVGIIKIDEMGNEDLIRIDDELAYMMHLRLDSHSIYFVKGLTSLEQTEEYNNNYTKKSVYPPHIIIDELKEHLRFYEKRDLNSTINDEQQLQRYSRFNKVLKNQYLYIQN